MSLLKILRGLSSILAPCLLVKKLNTLQGYPHFFLASEPYSTKGLKELYSEWSPPGRVWCPIQGQEKNSTAICCLARLAYPSLPFSCSIIFSSVLERPGLMPCFFSSFTGCPGMSVLPLCLRVCRRAYPHCSLWPHCDPVTVAMAVWRRGFPQVRGGISKLTHCGGMAWHPGFPLKRWHVQTSAASLSNFFSLYDEYTNSKVLL